MAGVRYWQGSWNPNRKTGEISNCSKSLNFILYKMSSVFSSLHHPIQPIPPVSISGLVPHSLLLQSQSQSLSPGHSVPINGMGERCSGEEDRLRCLRTELDSTLSCLDRYIHDYKSTRKLVANYPDQCPDLRVTREKVIEINV